MGRDTLHVSAKVSACLRPHTLHSLVFLQRTRCCFCPSLTAPLCQPPTSPCLLRNGAPLQFAPLGSFGWFLVAYRHATFIFFFNKKNTLTPFPQPVTTHVCLPSPSQQKLWGDFSMLHASNFSPPILSWTHSPNMVSHSWLPLTVITSDRQVASPTDDSQFPPYLTYNLQRQSDILDLSLLLKTCTRLAVQALHLMFLCWRPGYIAEPPP